MPYSNYPTRSHPGEIIIIADESIFSKQIINDSNKRERIPDQISNFLSELCIHIQPCGDSPLPIMNITLIGHGGNAKKNAYVLFRDNVCNLQNYVYQMLKEKLKISDGAGGQIEIEIDRAIYINSVEHPWLPAEDSAFELVKNIVYEIKKKDTEYTCVPLIINFTSGNSSLGSRNRLVDIANEIAQIDFSDGSPIIVNFLFTKECSGVNLPTSSIKGKEYVYESSTLLSGEWIETNKRMFSHCGYNLSSQCRTVTTDFLLCNLLSEAHFNCYDSDFLK